MFPCMMMYGGMVAAMTPRSGLEVHEHDFLLPPCPLGQWTGSDTQGDLEIDQCDALEHARTRQTALEYA